MSTRQLIASEPAAVVLPSFTPARKGLLQRKCACGGTPGPTGECEECRAKRLQRLPRNLQASSFLNDRQSFASEVPTIVHEVLSSPGRPLDAATRAFFEPRFEHDLSQVRVHTNAKAADSARAVSARAYTVGRDVVFGAEQYSSTTRNGQRLLAHELAHVVQQSAGAASMAPYGITDSQDPTEREAESAAQAVQSGQRPRIALKSTGTMLHREKDDLVAYSGGQSGSITVLQANKVIYSSSAAVSGHPGAGQHQKGEGPIPDGNYMMHPEITQPTVTTIQRGTCGADGFSQGYQEITSTDQSPCDGAHYCNISCPTPAKPAQKCFTPVDCWGPKRIKIEGSARVKKPGGGKVTRNGFFLHGGNPRDAVSSGCVKALNNDVFTEIRKLKGAVRFCVGTACPRALMLGVQAVESVKGVIHDISESLGL